MVANAPKSGSFVQKVRVAAIFPANEIDDAAFTGCLRDYSESGSQGAC